MADITAKIKVDGAAAFKKSINESKTAVAALDKELKLAEQEFKDTGDAETYMKTRGTLLNQKLEAQKKVLKAAQQGLDDLLKKGYEPNSKEVMTWRGRIADAATKLRETNREITNNKNGLDKAGKAYTSTGNKVKGMSDKLDKAETNTKDVNTALKNIDKGISLQNVSDALGKMNTALSNGIKKAGDLGKKLWNLTKGATDWADDLATQAKRSGLDTTTLQQWEYAAKFIDTDVEDIITARNRLAKNMGSESFAKLLGGNGIATRDALGNLRDGYDVMWDVLELLGTMDNATERDNLAMEIFGKSAEDLLPLIQAGRKEWEETASGAPIVSEENLQKLEKANDALQQLESELEVMKTSLLANLAPAMEVLAGAVGKFSEYLESEEGQAQLKKLTDAIAGLMEKVFDIDWGKAMEAAGAAIGAVADALVWITENYKLVLTALGAIAGAKIWTMLSNGAANIGKLVSGAKNLLGLGNAAGTGGTATAATGGGGGTTTVATGGLGALAKSGWGVGATKATVAATAAEMLITEGVVVAAAIAPALIAQNEINQKLIDEKEATEEAVEELKEINGNTENVQFVEAANASLGPQRDENGQYKQAAFGLGVNTASAGNAYDLLMGLSYRKNAEMAKLQALLQTYGRDNALGWDPWMMLQRIWNPRLGKEAWDESWSFSQAELDELLDVVRDAMIGEGYAAPAAPTVQATNVADEIIDKSSQEHDILMGLAERKDQQLAELRNAVVAQGGEDAWTMLMDLWQNDHLTMSQVQSLYEVLTRADASIVETAARRAAEEAAQAEHDAAVRNAVAQLMGLESRTGMQRADLMGGLNQFAAYTSTGESTLDLLNALWGGASLSDSQILGLADAIARAEEAKAGKGTVLTRDDIQQMTTVLQSGVTSAEVAALVASAVSQAKFMINGREAGIAVAPTVAEILARDNISR